MGAECCKNRKTSTVDLKVRDTDPNTIVLRATKSSLNGEPSTKNHIENDDSDPTQRLLSHKTSNHNDYLSIQSTLEPMDTNDYKPPIECQTPPMIKALFGTNSEPNDIETQTPKANIHSSHNGTITHQTQPNGIKPNHNHEQTPMGFGGDVYLGFESNNRPLSFQGEHRNSINEPNQVNNLNLAPPNNIIRNSSSTSSNSSNSSYSCASSSGSFTSNSDDEWTPILKPENENNNPLLMGFAQQNDIVSFHGHEWDAMLANKEHNQFTLSAMSLNSAHLADMVITGVGEGASSSFSSLKSFLFTPNKHQMQWIIATFNVFIEYFPYKHIMQLIFGYCSIDINAFDFVFPNTLELENKYNYYDTPTLYVENVSITNKHQPCLVLMIGAPGSGKTSYATYRYSKQCVVCADDYFDVHHGGEFIGSLLKEAHRYCLEEVMKRLHKKETVVVANTHSNYWQLYDKIVPVLFDASLPHKIVFAVMPEANSTTLVRRCLHSCTETKIINYAQNIRYMLRDGGISVDKVLKYGHMENNTDYMENRTRWNMAKSNKFLYGLWIDSDGYRIVQDWYQHKTNANLMCDAGDARISPIIECTWPVFKKTFRKWMVLSKFTSENDPVIDLEVRIIGYAKHSIAQMVAVEIIDSSLSIHQNKEKYNKNTMLHMFWRMFKRQMNTDSMGCVLAMKKGVPFNTAKYLFDYNCIQYINDGPIVKAKLATKRYVRNYIKYYTVPPPIHNDVKSPNNVFFNVEGAVAHRDILSPDYKGAVIDKSSFALKLREKHSSHKLQNMDNSENMEPIEAKQDENDGNTINNLNPEAQEFKMEEKHETLNPSAIEFKPIPQQPMQYMNLLNAPQLLPNTMNFMLQQHNMNLMLQQQQQLLQQNMTCLPAQAVAPANVQNHVWNAAMNGNTQEFKMMENTKMNGFKPQQMQPTANEFKPQQSQLPQLQQSQMINNPFQAQASQTQNIDYSGMAAYAGMKQSAFQQQIQATQVNHVNAVPPFVPNAQSNTIMNGNHNINMNGNAMNQPQLGYNNNNNNNNNNMNMNHNVNMYANNAIHINNATNDNDNNNNNNNNTMFNRM